jgi:hypothetical protein
MILETIVFLFLSSVLFISLVGYGQIFISRYSSDLLTSFLFGFIILSFLLTGIHFFTKINFYINIIVLLIGILLFYYRINFYFIEIYKKKKFIYFFIFLLLIPIFLSQKYHEDFGYYHLPYLISFSEHKIIFGLANSNTAFTHNSLWLNIIGIYFLPGNNFNFVTLPTFLTYIVFIFFCFKKNIEYSGKKISNYFLLISLFYFIVKFTRLSEFGNDIPSTIFSILSIFYFLKFSETSDLKKCRRLFFFNFAFSIFAILIKFSCIPILFLTIYLFIKNYKKLIIEIFRIEFIIIYLLVLFFFLQQFFYTGCLIFPSQYSCFNVSWFNNEILSLRENLELTNKSYFSVNTVLSKEEYLKKFSWLPFWAQRNYSEILEHLTTILLPISLLFIFSNKSNKKNNLKFNNKKLFLIFILIGFIFWLKLSPVYRFAIPYFLSLIFILTFDIYSLREFSKKSFIIFILIALTFNFSKNLLRLSNKSQIYYGIEKINNLFITEKSSTNNFIDVFTPDLTNNQNGWQGRLCWDIPFLCTYSKININKRKGYLFLSKLNN